MGLLECALRNFGRRGLCDGYQLDSREARSGSLCEAISTISIIDGVNCLVFRFVQTSLQHRMISTAETLGPTYVRVRPYCFCIGGLFLRDRS